MYSWQAPTPISIHRLCKYHCSDLILHIYRKKHNLLWRIHREFNCTVHSYVSTQWN